MLDIVVDVEADGPCPGLYSMVSFGAAVYKDGECHTFYSGTLLPISDKYNERALSVSNTTREDQLKGIDHKDALISFVKWLATFDGSFIFWSDNVAFDWQFINYYFHLAGYSNPFGYSGRRIGDFYAGYCLDARAASKWKHLRETKHTHNPADDAKGNLEALLKIKSYVAKASQDS